MEGYQQGGGGGRMGEKVRGRRSINGRYKIDRGRLRMRNGEAEELVCLTHGHELRWEGAYREEGNKGEEKKMGQL